MSYLRFEKAVMTNLEESIRKELLRTNRSGAYSCSTIVDCNTRKYHGLLVVPVPELDDENHVLLSSLDPTVMLTLTQLQPYGSVRSSPSVLFVSLRMRTAQPAESIVLLTMVSRPVCMLAIPICICSSPSRTSLSSSPTGIVA